MSVNLRAFAACTPRTRPAETDGYHTTNTERCSMLAIAFGAKGRNYEGSSLRKLAYTNILKRRQSLEISKLR